MPDAKQIEAVAMALAKSDNCYQYERTGRLEPCHVRRAEVALAVISRDRLVLDMAETLQAILWLRPAGDVLTAKEARELLQEMECLARAALAKVGL